MPKPFKFIYEKKIPFRDAFFFIIVCEGKNREPHYFRFFDGLSSRVKVVAVESGNDSAPARLIKNAIDKERELEAIPDRDRLWFVIDTDAWREQLHEIRRECKKYLHWKVAQSNPCFEVWLYFHVKSAIPDLEDISQCNKWKPFLNQLIRGGFNSDFHPVAIEAAIINSKACYAYTGYFPEPGCTQLWQLGEELLPLIKKELEDIKGRFPPPVQQ
jgi:hypothetical protein